jgi:hypothetical protein
MVHPKQFPFYPEHVPKELKIGKFWVCCDGSKIPQVPGSFRRGSSTDPATWREYAEAAAWYAHGRHCGIGRVIAHGDPYVGIDLDNVRDPQTRRIKPDARKVLDLLDSYSEVSPSGTGVKVWVRASLDRSYVKPGVEVYVRGRYFTVTGQNLAQYPEEIARRQAEVEALIKREFSRPGRGASAVTGGPYDGPPVDLGGYLEGVEVLSELHDGLGTKFAIVCPWRSEHTGGDLSGTYVGQRARGGGLWFRCWHAHCMARTWRDFRERVRPKNVIHLTRRSGSPNRERRVNISRG